MSTNRDQTSTNGKIKASLTTFVWAPRSENAFSAVILASKDVFKTFFGTHNGVYGAIFWAMWGDLGPWGVVWVMLGFFEGFLDFFGLNMTQNDPK